MTLQIISDLPVVNAFIYKSEKTLAHKKLDGQLLTSFEEARHNILMGASKNYKGFFEEKNSRILNLNGARLFDSTAEKCAKVCPHNLWDFHLLETQFVLSADNQMIKLQWGREHNTDYAVVRDGAKPGHFEIFELETEREAGVPGREIARRIT